MADELTDHLNEDHADTVLFLARSYGAPGAREAQISGFDLAGVDLDVDDAPVRIAFAEPAASEEGVWAAALDLLVRARTAAPADLPLTSLERDYVATEQARVFVTQVVRTRQVTPHMKEITFAGGLEGFRPQAPDTWMWVLLPPLPIGPGATYTDISSLPEDQRPVGKNYTVRRWDPATGELDIWFVLHGDSGPCSAWAARADVGDEVGLWGPRAAHEPPTGTTNQLLLADETGLPGALAILEALPDGVDALALVEVASAEEEVAGADPRIRWVHRDRGESLLDAVKGLDLADPSGWYAWGGAESRDITAIRRHLRETVGFPREACCLVGYWRR
jgi:NADPH-dependent ferric siderophore reductase